MLITDFVASASNKRKVEASLRLNRRAFLQAALVAAGAGVACTTNGTPWRFLTVDEARTLAAISDQIIPPAAHKDFMRRYYRRSIFVIAHCSQSG